MTDIDLTDEQIVKVIEDTRHFMVDKWQYTIDEAYECMLENAQSRDTDGYAIIRDRVISAITNLKNTACEREV